MKFPTITGKFIDLDCMVMDDIEIVDIAHSLSRINRYNGHTIKPYSVAEHSCIMFDHMDLTLKKAALLHDAHEAYIGDIVKPVKIKFPALEKLSNRIQNLINEKYQVNTFHHEVVFLDSEITFAEIKQLNPSAWGKIQDPKQEYVTCRIEGWTPTRAQREFLRRWKSVS